MYNWNDSTFAKISWKWNTIFPYKFHFQENWLEIWKTNNIFMLDLFNCRILRFLRFFFKYITENKIYQWCDYLGSTLTLMGIFKIEQAITALSAAAFLQIFEEGVVSRVARSDDFDIYLSFVFDVEDHISVLFVFLYLFVRCLANVCDCYSRCLVKHRWT